MIYLIFRYRNNYTNKPSKIASEFIPIRSMSVSFLSAPPMFYTSERNCGCPSVKNFESFEIHATFSSLLIPMKTVPSRNYFGLTCFQITMGRSGMIRKKPMRFGRVERKFARYMLRLITLPGKDRLKCWMRVSNAYSLFLQKFHNHRNLLLTDT